MLNIAIVLLNNAYCSSISGLIDLLQIANAHSRRLPGSEENPFQWSLLSERAGEQVAVKGGIRLVSDGSLKSADKYDLVYLPGVYYSGINHFDQWLKSQQSLHGLLRNLAKKNIKIAANCTATFLLAETGILNDKLATTTWWLEQQFRHRYPRVKLDANLALTRDSNIYCAGAMTAYNQLALRLVDEYASPEIAALCSKTMLISQGNLTQTPYQNLNTTISTEDTLVAKAQYWLRNHMSTDVGFSQLAQELDVSQRTLIRRFKQATNTTPLSYLQNLRLEHTKVLLEQSPLSVTDIMVEVGYNDPSAFSRLFKQRIGLTPSVYRQRFTETVNAT